MVISTAIFYSTRKHKIFNKIVAVCITAFCVAVLMVNLHSVNTLIEREKNIKDYRFPISQIDSEQLLVIKNHYKQYGAESKIIVFGKAGCPECEKMYPELEEIAENMPVSFAYFDCYAARVYNEMQLEEILQYFEVESVPTVIAIKDDKLYRFEYDDNISKNLETFLDDSAKERYYFTDFSSEYIEI